MSTTLADTLRANESLSVHCAHPACCRSTRLDVKALIDKLGPDHGAMHWDLVKLFRCSACDAEGRERRSVFFTFVPDYAGIQSEANRNWKPVFPKP